MLVSELESNLGDTEELDGKWRLNFHAGVYFV